MKEGRGHPAAARAVGLTRAGMWWEALARAFWPLGVVLALVLAARWAVYIRSILLMAKF